MKKIEPLLFVAMGNFITACYTRNWTWLDLLRRPVVLEGKIVNNICAFDAPTWFPSNDAILCLDDGWMQSKLKDLPFQRKEKSVDQSRKIISMKLEIPRQRQILSARLIYSPWLRFVVEPMDFHISRNIAAHVARIVDYALRREGFMTEITEMDEFSRVVVDGGRLTFEASGREQLEKLEVFKGEARLASLDLSARSLSISPEVAPALSQAFATMMPNITLINCDRSYDGDRMVLSYVQ